MSTSTVLVIDDDPQVFELVRFHLEGMVAEVLHADSGEQGVARAQEEQPDVILLDVGLPGMDGFEVCRLIKATQSIESIPLLFLTADGDAFNAAKGLESGAMDYITKPFVAVELQARVRSALLAGKQDPADVSLGDVLVIDDDPNVHNLMEFYLEPHARRVLHANRPKDGLRLAEEEKPDVILLDLQMPWMNGFQVCQNLKSNPATAGIPVLFLTADQRSDRAARALNGGAVDYITKPVVAAELLARLKAACRRRRAG